MKGLGLILGLEQESFRRCFPALAIRAGECKDQVSRAWGESVLLLTTHTPLTLWLFLVGGDGSHEILRGHENLGLAVLVDDLQRGKVSEDFVWCGVGSDPVLIFHHLGMKFSQR